MNSLRLLALLVLGLVCTCDEGIANKAGIKICNTRCPADATQTANCGCQCQNRKKVYRGGSCVCKTRRCGFYQVINQQTCQCETTRCTQCPLYSTRTADCRCACNQGRTMVNGRCVCNTWSCYLNQVINQQTSQFETRCTNQCPLYYTRTADCRCACNQGRTMVNGRCESSKSSRNS